MLLHLYTSWLNQCRKCIATSSLPKHYRVTIDVTLTTIQKRLSIIEF